MEKASVESVSLKQAKGIIAAMAHKHSVLLLSGPGVGKSDAVYQAAASAQLACRSLVGTQIAPEDVSGIPRIINERSVFCPPRVLLPEQAEKFCLFLDELPACTPDIQKAFYSLLLERRLGEHLLPDGTWVVAAGNRLEDRALIRALSSALINRVIILHVRVEADEWFEWAMNEKLRPEILEFLDLDRQALSRAVPNKAVPFSTPRAWASLARALDLVESTGQITSEIRMALAAGRLSFEDAKNFCMFAERQRLAHLPVADFFPARTAYLLNELGIESMKQASDEPSHWRQGASSTGANRALRVLNNRSSRSSSRMDSDVRLAKDFSPELIKEAFVKAYVSGGVPEEWIDSSARIPTVKIPQQFEAVQISLQQAKKLVQVLGADESLLLQAAPGVGKTAIVEEAAREKGLHCRSLLGTQIAPEDVSGIPRIVGERSVFCPPRVLLPEQPERFCLFLDELPACSSDVQKAFYPLLLERRLGEHALPEGSWVVAAGNRVEDRALVRDLSSALINRLFLLQIRVDIDEWVEWAEKNKIRKEVVDYVRFTPEALLRPVPAEPVPFSTPRAWAMLAEALDLAESSGILTPAIRRALAFGRVSAEDAAMFCEFSTQNIPMQHPPEYFIEHPDELPKEETARWFILNRIRKSVEFNRVRLERPGVVNKFFSSLSLEHRLVLIVDLVEKWAALGAEEIMYETLWKVTGVKP